MRKLFVILMFIPLTIFSQKKKKFTDVVSNIEARALMMKPFGNNTFSKDLQWFAGFGIGGNLMTPINFGIGADYNMLFSNLKLDRINYYGNLGGPKAQNIDVYITHRDELSEDFFLEEIIGYSFLDIRSAYISDKNKTYRQTGGGVQIGGKLIYNLDRNGYQQFVLSGRAQTFSTDVYNENAETQNYYSKSFMASLSFGYRYNF